MTQAMLKRFNSLTHTTAKYAPKVATKTAQPFASSAAKYYPALKRLAAK